MIGDAINNVGVIVSALVIWFAHYPGRYYADPGVSMGIAFMILASSIPLGRCDRLLLGYASDNTFAVKNSGSILLESVPVGANLDDIRHDLELVRLQYATRDGRS